MKLSDTLTGEKRDFAPASDEVKMYVCGVTPYAPSHVGHGMSYIIFDVLHRYLEFKGFKVKRVQNFTDIDDKLIARAAQEGTSVEELSSRLIDEYFEDMAALNVREADVYPRATQEVPKIIEVIAGLIEKDCAYESDGDVYFRVTRDPAYGKLSHRSLDGMRAGARIEVGAEKEHPMDFTLWKAAKPGEPAWDSPWGQGRPGWHIECTAMALRYLGDTIDIHGGGADLVFPHHENEIAQSEAFTGEKPFSRFWVHNGLLHLDREKMSKSLGNLVSIRDALAKYSPDALRFGLLNAHYRGPGYYSDEGLAGAEAAADRVRQALNAPSNAGGGGKLEPAAAREQFTEAMDDDLNTPRALAAFHTLARDINRESSEGHDVGDAQAVLEELGRSVLGLTFLALETEVNDELATHIEALVSKRTAHRAAKEFTEADAARNELSALGVTLTDSADGTAWKLTGE
jgi:cysteinyl-tRNA synthetase